jgi:hypothetical protein
MDRHEYVVAIVDALNGMAVKMASATPPFDPESIPRERAEAVAGWRDQLVRQVRDSIVAELDNIKAPEELQAFHSSLLRCIREPVQEERHTSWHAAPSTEGWPRVMMRLAVLCQQERVPFPTSKPQRNDAPEPEPAHSASPDWRAKVRRELEIRGDPDPDETITTLEQLRNKER